MKVFSFCLYGTEPNYYTGLLENVAILQKNFPDFSIVVYRGVCDPSWDLPETVTVIDTGREGAVNMLYRYLPLQEMEVGFVRDTDSRVTPRDEWCIREFLKSSYSYHMIRDHLWHKSKIMGGLFGWKKPLPDSIVIPTQSGYGADEAYLSEHVYPRILPDLLVHTNILAFVGEHAERIAVETTDPADFVGNVIWDGAPRFVQIHSPVDWMRTAQGHDQFDLMVYLSEQQSPLSIPYEARHDFFMSAFIAQYYLGNTDKAQEWLRQYEFAEITPHVHRNADCLLPRLGTIVASFDPTVEPKEGETMIYYGNYPDCHLALPCSNRIYRHISRFFQTTHSKILYHPSWEPVDRIYILNLEERVDRYYETLLALAAVQAPLHRVVHYKAQRDALPPYVGATKNHVDCMEHFCKSDAKQALILEDDFVFVDDKARVWSSLDQLWSSSPTYTLCFLSLSKIGRREPHSEGLLQSFQSCTTSSGYLLRRDTANQVLEVATEGLQKMQETGDHHTYCIDRYWSKLPDILCIRPKIGFQRPSYSNLLRSVSAHLD